LAYLDFLASPCSGTLDLRDDALFVDLSAYDVTEQFPALALENYFKEQGIFCG
jgi:hypothetical protein